MSKLIKESEQYIEHEVQLRVHNEKFKIIEKSLDDVKTSVRHLDVKFDAQFKWIIGMFVSSIVIPVIFHFIKAV